MSPSGEAIYTYDGNGNRLQATRNSTVTKYIYDARGNLLAEADSANTIQRYYIYGLGLLAMVEPTGETYTYHYNGIGSTVAMTDQDKDMVNKYYYTAFGILTNEEETIPQPFKYVAQYGIMYEPNGLYYMRARYYDAETGRFISEDPIGFEGGDVNLYAYVGNNPVNFIDPSGLFKFGKRPLENKPWIPIISSNPIDDALNTEFSHEHGFFEDGSGDNFGFSREGIFSEDPSGKDYRFDDVYYDDSLMRQALNNTINNPENQGNSYLWIGNNCQNFSERWREEYYRIQNTQPSLSELISVGGSQIDWSNK